MSGLERVRVWLALGLLGLQACAGADCGPGTLLADGECIAADAEAICGKGAELRGGVCVPGAKDTSVEVACVPVCDGKVCGDDGCGGACGGCGPGTHCAAAGTCIDDDCKADCATKVCGDDGCGGACGTCTDPAAPTCQDGACVGECVSDCLGRACGDDRCGVSCGSCAAGLACSAGGACVASDWTCEPLFYGTGNGCDCECGAVDPDCDDDHLATVGCGADEICVAGECSPRTPATWTCAAVGYDDGYWCNCDCGAGDPDCGSPAAPVLGCPPGACEKATGVCGPCVPACVDKVCGDDGCGGSCGECNDGEDAGEKTLACLGGKCVEGCTPTPLQCETAVCGDDGCGGSCGTCAEGAECVAGQCEPLPGFTCKGLCGLEAPGGCACSVDCAVNFDCCPDFVDLCYCAASCEGKNCGGDGCGGSCGVCAGTGTPYCGQDGVCTSTCQPDCVGKACGSDGCGSTCGSCGDGEVCSDAGQCLPPEWVCAPFQWGNASCQCGCGAPDPDCVASAYTTACPQGVGCDTATGSCDASFCGKDGDCTPPKACVGHYLAAAGARKGICGPPIPGAGAYGALCSTDGQCAHGVCGGGQCSRHCEGDGDCPDGQACIGLPQTNLLSGAPSGALSVCDGGGAAISDVCAKQADCGARTCLGLVHPTTHAALFRCGAVIGPAAGSECTSTAECGRGLLCANEECRLACPGGQADCPGNQVCGSTTLHGGPTGLSTDDVLVPTCVDP